MKVFAKIRYLGTGFHGFQVQPDMRTVQGELCRALDLAYGLPCRVTGCSRTDAGVHANTFAITVENEGGTIPPERLPVAVAKFLPQDISLYYAKECKHDFHPRYDVLSKEYLYRILNTAVADPFFVDRAWFFPRKITDDGLLRMRDASAHLLGRHDFSTFMAPGGDAGDTVRNMMSISVSHEGDFVNLRFRADGFLYHMVRLLVGSLVDCAFGRFDPADFPEMLRACDNRRAGMTAPAAGLYLDDVAYPDGAI